MPTRWPHSASRARWPDVAPKVARRAEISPFYVMEVMRAAEQREMAGGEVLHLEVGQPSTPAPKAVIEAAHRALDEDVLGYTVAYGIDPLRRRIAEHYTDWYSKPVSAEHVVVTVGASNGCALAFLGCFDVGDRVAVPAPGYPCYRTMLEASGVETVEVPVDAASRFQPTPELLEACGPIDGLVVASPSNPTGTMLGDDEMAALARWCDAHDVRLISDEVYHGITYEGAAPTALAHSDSAVIVNSFSKYFSMTGWRLGWLVLPTDLAVGIERLAQNVVIAAPTLSQIAAVAAFDCHDELEANVTRYAANRRVLLDGLPTAGLDRLAPVDGAFYVYAAVDHLTDDSQRLCADWLEQLGLATTPGIDFDPTRGHQYVRFSFAGATADMEEAVSRLVGWCEGAPG